MFVHKVEFQSLIVIYRRDNFLCPQRGCTSIYRPLSYPFISVAHMTKHRAWCLLDWQREVVFESHFNNHVKWQLGILAILTFFFLSVKGGCIDICIRPVQNFQFTTLFKIKFITNVLFVYLNYIFRVPQEHFKEGVGEVDLPP